jgi:hypothetical protein
MSQAQRLLAVGAIEGGNPSPAVDVERAGPSKPVPGQAAPAKRTKGRNEPWSQCRGDRRRPLVLTCSQRPHTIVVAILRNKDQCQCVARKPQRHAPRETDCGKTGVATRFELAEGDVGINVWSRTMIELPGVIGSGMRGSNGQRKPGTTNAYFQAFNRSVALQQRLDSFAGGYSHPLEWRPASLRTNSML